MKIRARNILLRRCFCGDKSDLGYERTNTDGSDGAHHAPPPLAIPPTHKLTPQIFFLFCHGALVVLLLCTKNRFILEWKNGEYTHDIVFLVLWVWTVLQFCYLVNANPGFAAMAPMPRRDYKRRLSIPSAQTGQYAKEIAAQSEAAAAAAAERAARFSELVGVPVHARGGHDQWSLRPPATSGMAKDPASPASDPLSPAAASIELGSMPVESAAQHVATDLETWPSVGLENDPRSPPVSSYPGDAASHSGASIAGILGSPPAPVAPGGDGAMFMGAVASHHNASNGTLNGVAVHPMDVRSPPPASMEASQGLQRDDWVDAGTVAISLSDGPQLPDRGDGVNGGNPRAGAAYGGGRKARRQVRIILPDNRVRVPGEDSAKSVDAHRGKSPFSPTHVGENGAEGEGNGKGRGGPSSRLALAAADSDEDALALLQADASMSDRPWEVGAEGELRGGNNRFVNSRFVGVSPWRRQEASVGRSCPYCKLWQPIRAKHCHECNACVYRFDHHCFWIGGCIGQANHGKFWLYLFLQTLTGMWKFYIFVAVLQPRRQFGEWLAVNCFYLTLMLIGGMMLMFITGLLLFHTFLIFTNQTTWEVASTQGVTYMSGIPDSVRPFSLGVLRNIKQFATMGHAAPIIYQIPSQAELARRDQACTLCDNPYYSCC